MGLTNLIDVDNLIDFTANGIVSLQRSNTVGY